jgi:hypothetical protein
MRRAVFIDTALLLNRGFCEGFVKEPQALAQKLVPVQSFPRPLNLEGNFPIR